MGDEDPVRGSEGADIKDRSELRAARRALRNEEITRNKIKLLKYSLVVIGALFVLLFASLNPSKEEHVKELVSPMKYFAEQAREDLKNESFGWLKLILINAAAKGDVFHQQIEYHNRFFYSFTTTGPEDELVSWGYFGCVFVDRRH